MTEPPAVVGMALDEVDTPALLVDLDAFDHNIEHLAKFAAEHSVQLRPHAKMHKSPPVAWQQIRAGAIGVCCQKVGEAEAMANAGIDDILITNEVWGRSKLERIAGLARTGSEIKVCVDDRANVDDLDAVARAFGVTLELVVEINVSGNLQCGVAAGRPAIELAAYVAKQSNLRFGGLQAYDGPAQHMREFIARQQSVERAIELAGTTRDMLEASGLECRRVSGGGTGTYALEGASGVFTELQAGSYAFMDLDYSRNLTAAGGAYDDFEQSLSVYSTVMSRPERDSGVLDAGIKAYSIDSGPPAVAGHPGLKWVGGGDEHGKFTSESGPFPFSNGDKVKVTPGHCDPTVNLYDWLVGVRGDRVEAVWPVSARGANR